MLFRCYHPKSKSGKPVKFIHWHINFYKFLLVWPLENPNKFYTFLYFQSVVVYIVGVFLNSYTFLTLENYDDILQVTEALVHLATFTCSFIRNLNRFSNMNLLKQIVKITYKYVYVSEEENQVLHKACEKEIKTMFSMVKHYFTTLIIFFLPVIIYFFRFPLSPGKPNMFSVKLPHSENVAIYLISNLCLMYAGFMNCSIWNGEDSFIYITLNYTYARYKILHNELDQICSKTSESSKFFEKINDILKEQQLLIK